MATPKIKRNCPHCPLRVDADKFQEHVIRCEMNKPYMCDIPECGRRFATPTSVSSHKSRQHTAEERKTKHSCRFCLHGSDDPKALDKHEKMHAELGGPGFRRRSRSRSRGPAPDRSTSTLDDSTVALDTSNTSLNVIETVPKPVENRQSPANESIRIRTHGDGAIPSDGNRQSPATESIRIRTHGEKPSDGNRQLPTTESIRIRAHGEKPAEGNRQSPATESIRIRTHGAIPSDGNRQSPPTESIRIRTHENGEQRKSRLGSPNNGPQNERISGEFEPPMVDATIPNVGDEREEPTDEPMDEEVQMVPVIPPVPVPPQFDRNYLMSVTMLNPEYAERRFQQYKEIHNDTVRQIRKQNKMVREFCKANGIGLSENDPIEKLIREYEDQFGKLADENVEAVDE